MNNCFILLLLLFCCGNNGCSDMSGRMSRCGRNDNDNSCGCGRETRNDCGCGRETRNDCGCGRESRNNDSCMERSFGSFPSPGSTCGCEEKE